MAEYIEREAAVNIAYNYCHTTDGRCCGPDDVVELWEELKAIPTADVAPVRRGRWEQKEVFEAKGRVEELQSAFCPACQRYHTTPYSYYYTHYDYCPHCGAKMEEKE